MEEKTKKMKPTIEAMSIGDVQVFPLEKMFSVRSIVSGVSYVLDRTYKTETNKHARTIRVVRVS